MNYALRDTTGQRYPVGVRLQIGRDPANQIVIQDQMASRFHCTLTENQGILILQDENSSNGTYVNQTRIQGQIQLNAGDTISIGDTHFIVEQLVEQTANPLPPINVPQPSTQTPYAYQPPVVNIPAAAPVAKPPVVKKGGISPIFPLIFIILVSLICIGSAILGYLYYKAPLVEKNKVLNYFGKGPATVQVENFSDNTVYVFATTSLDSSATDENAMGIRSEVNSFGTFEKTDLDTEAYRLDFGSQSVNADLGTCIFYIKGGEIYHFVILPDAILIDRTEYPKSKQKDPSSVDEMDVATSSLCKYTH